MPQRSIAQHPWSKWFKAWQGLDWLLIFLPVVMTIFASIVILSTQINLEQTAFGWNHLIMGSLSLVLTLLIARSRYENLIRWQWIVYAATNLSLLAVIFVGTVGSGAQRWITIGGFNVQPSEFAKLGLIITLAGVLRGREASTILGLVKALAITAVPWSLVFLQPDLGTSLVFGAITLGMLYWGNANPGDRKSVV